MGIQIVWDDEGKTILRHVYDKKWTIDEYYALVNDNYKIIEDAGRKIDIINDLREMGPLPDGVITAIRYAARHAHPNEGVKIMVGASMYVRALVSSINTTFATEGVKVTHVTTLEEARAIIAKSRAC
jgi:hypothetical protein